MKDVKCLEQGLTYEEHSAQAYCRNPAAPDSFQAPVRVVPVGFCSVPMNEGATAITAPTVTSRSGRESHSLPLPHPKDTSQLAAECGAVAEWEATLSESGAGIQQHGFGQVKPGSWQMEVPVLVSDAVCGQARFLC